MGEVVALIGLLIAIASMIGGAIWILYGHISRGHSEIKAEIANISNRIQTLERDNYTKPEAEAHALRLALNNPHLRVPDPRDPTQILHVPRE